MAAWALTATALEERWLPGHPRCQQPRATTSSDAALAFGAPALQVLALSAGGRCDDRAADESEHLAISSLRSRGRRSPSSPLSGRGGHGAAWASVAGSVAAARQYPRRVDFNDRAGRQRHPRRSRRWPIRDRGLHLAGAAADLRQASVYCTPTAEHLPLRSSAAGMAMLKRVPMLALRSVVDRGGRSRLRNLIRVRRRGQARRLVQMISPGLDWSARLFRGASPAA